MGPVGTTRVSDIGIPRKGFSVMQTLSIRRLLPALASILLLALLQPAAAQENIRIGVVNLDRILRDSNAAKTSLAKLESEFSKRSKDLQDAGARLKAAADKFEKDAPVLSDTDRQRRQREVADMDKDLQRRQREINEDFNQRKQEEAMGVQDRANKALRQLAESEKYDLVITDGAFVSPKIDITDKLLKLMNAAGPTTTPTK